MLAALRCVVSIGVAMLCASATAAQEQQQRGKQDVPPEHRTAAMRDALVQEVQAQLRSGDARTSAWGAHRAAEHRLLACRDDLRAALRKFAKDDPDGTRYAANVVLDALVQTVATVPIDELEPFFELSGAVALVLRDEHGADVLLRVFRKQHVGSASWRACGNVLVAKNSAEVALAALRAPVQPWVQVHDGKPLDEAYPPESVGCTFDHEHIDWPSFPRYDFAFSPDAGLHAVCGGPLPVFRTRVLRGTAGRCHWSSEWMLPDARAAWLVHLLGKEQAEAVRAIDKHRMLRWRDADSYPADVRALRAEIEADWRKVVAACVDAKVITADAAKALAPEIVLDVMNVFDVRQDVSVPLPDRTIMPRVR